MKPPICRVCLSSETLCKDCKEKLDTGEISQAEIDLSRALATLSEQHPALEKAEFNKVMVVRDLFLVVVPKGSAGQLIGRGGQFIKKISSELGKNVKVVEETKDNKEIIQRVLFPAKLLGVNVVSTADNKEAYKVRVAGMDRNKIMDQDSMKQLFRELLGGETSIVFE